MSGGHGEPGSIQQQPTFGPGQVAATLGAEPGFPGGKAKPGERKNTSGTLNRNESQSQLTTSFEPLDQREVELRAQSGENSQLFMESQFTNAGGLQVMNRFNNMDSFGGNEFEDDREMGMLAQQ